MTRFIRSTTLLALFTFLLTDLAHAARLPRKLAAQLQQQKLRQQAVGDLQTAPVPPQIASAHTVFISNQGADQTFPGTAEEAYTALYNSIKAWGRYQVVATPAEADLVFQLRAVAPITNVVSGDDNSPGYTVTSPAFRITILDAHTNVTLWTVTSPVDLGNKAKERNHWYAVDVTNATSRLKVLAGDQLSPTETADLTSQPKYSHKALWVMLGIFGGIAAAGTVAGIITVRNMKNDEKATQDAWCKQDKFFCTNTALAH